MELEIIHVSENTCDKCECAHCGNYDCPAPCKSAYSCDNAVTKCKEYK